MLPYLALLGIAAVIGGYSKEKAKEAKAIKDKEDKERLDYLTDKKIKNPKYGKPIKGDTSKFDSIKIETIDGETVNIFVDSIKYISRHPSDDNNKCIVKYRDESSLNKTVELDQHRGAIETLIKILRSPENTTQALVDSSLRDLISNSIKLTEFKH